jgi:hypothetical protein
MLHIEPVDLRPDPYGVILPRDRIGIVMAQPHVPDSCLSSDEPYRWVEQAKPAQLAVLTETLTVARETHHGVCKTHFTIFPEYSIPGLDGVGVVESVLNCDRWPTSTIVIGGTDGLTKSEYRQMADGQFTHIDEPQNGHDRVPDDEWVNCCVTWVKATDGNVHKWIQPKLHPSWPELKIQYEHMFRGRSIYLFQAGCDNGSTYRFATLVCFDWIALIEDMTPCQCLLSHMDKRANGNILPLNWLFVIQRNPKPSDDAFLIKVREFFDRTSYPHVLRDKTCLIFANTAGLAVPGPADQFGASCLIMSPASLFVEPPCPPTFSNGGPRFRDGKTLLESAQLQDTFFRERGACIHSFAQNSPETNAPGPPGRKPALENAHVFPVSKVKEPRAPGSHVPAVVKWVNDELDGFECLPSPGEAAILAPEAKIAHSRIVAMLRPMSPQQLARAIQLAVERFPRPENGSEDSSKPPNADAWGKVESGALEHLVQSLDILSLAFPTLTVGHMPPHATILIEHSVVEVFAIRGSTHEACIAHSRVLPLNLQRRVVVVSRDPHNTLYLDRFGSILDAEAPPLTDEAKFARPLAGFVYIGYQNLFEIFRHATAPVDIKGGICAEPTACTTA